MAKNKNLTENFALFKKSLNNLNTYDKSYEPKFEVILKQTLEALSSENAEHRKQAKEILAELLSHETKGLEDRLLKYSENNEVIEYPEKQLSISDLNSPQLTKYFYKLLKSLNTVKFEEGKTTGTTVFNKLAELYRHFSDKEDTLKEGSAIGQYLKLLGNLTDFDNKPLTPTQVYNLLNVKLYNSQQTVIKKAITENMMIGSEPEKHILEYFKDHVEKTKEPNQQLFNQVLDIAIKAQTNNPSQNIKFSATTTLVEYIITKEPGLLKKIQMAPNSSLSKGEQPVLSNLFYLSQIEEPITISGKEPAVPVWQVLYEQRKELGLTAPQDHPIAHAIHSCTQDLDENNKKIRASIFDYLIHKDRSQKDVEEICQNILLYIKSFNKISLPYLAPTNLLTQQDLEMLLAAGKLDKNSLLNFIREGLYVQGMEEIKISSDLTLLDEIVARDLKLKNGEYAIEFLEKQQGTNDYSLQALSVYADNPYIKIAGKNPVQYFIDTKDVPKYNENFFGNLAQQLKPVINAGRITGDQLMQLRNTSNNLDEPNGLSNEHLNQQIEDDLLQDDQSKLILPMMKRHPKNFAATPFGKYIGETFELTKENVSNLLDLALDRNPQIDLGQKFYERVFADEQLFALLDAKLERLEIPPHVLNYKDEQGKTVFERLSTKKPNLNIIEWGKNNKVKSVKPLWQWCLDHKIEINGKDPVLVYLATIEQKDISNNLINYMAANRTPKEVQAILMDEKVQGKLTSAHLEILAPKLDCEFLRDYVVYHSGYSTGLEEILLPSPNLKGEKEPFGKILMRENFSSLTKEADLMIPKKGENSLLQVKLTFNEPIKYQYATELYLEYKGNDPQIIEKGQNYVQKHLENLQQQKENESAIPLFNDLTEQGKLTTEHLKYMLENKMINLDYIEEKLEVLTKNKELKIQGKAPYLWMLEEKNINDDFITKDHLKIIIKLANEEDPKSTSKPYSEFLMQLFEKHENLTIEGEQVLKLLLDYGLENIVTGTKKTNDIPIKEKGKTTPMSQYLLRTRGVLKDYFFPNYKLSLAPDTLAEHLAEHLKNGEHDIVQNVLLLILQKQNQDVFTPLLYVYMNANKYVKTPDEVTKLQGDIQRVWGGLKEEYVKALAPKHNENPLTELLALIEENPRFFKEYCKKIGNGLSKDQRYSRTFSAPLSEGEEKKEMKVEFAAGKQDITLGALVANLELEEIAKYGSVFQAITGARVDSLEGFAAMWDKIAQFFKDVVNYIDFKVTSSKTQSKIEAEFDRALLNLETSITKNKLASPKDVYKDLKQNNYHDTEKYKVVEKQFNILFKDGEMQR